MPLRKAPDSSLLNSDQLPLDTTTTPNTYTDDPPPAYGSPLPSSEPADDLSPQAQDQLQPAAAAPPPESDGYSHNPPMSSCTSPPALKPWEIDPATREHLEKAPGCFCSETGGCFCSDMGGFCFSSNAGCFFSDNKGCFFSDHAGCCFGDYGGCFCSGGPLK